MSYFVVYDSGGVILQVGTWRLQDIPGTQRLLKSNEYLAKSENCVSTDTHYVSEGVILQKKEYEFPHYFKITADSVDEATISPVPIGTLVRWPDNKITQITDGEVSFSVDLSGIYTLVFEAVEYLRKEVIIEAVPATES